MKKTNRKILTFIFMFGCIFLTTSSFAEFLTVEQYVKKVEENNNTLKEINYQIEATTKKFKESYRAYSTYLNSNLNYTHDKTKAFYFPSSAFSNQDTAILNFDVSVNKQFKTGTLFSAGYGSSDTSIEYIVPKYTTTDMAPYIALEQSLMQNLNGDLTKISIAKFKASAESLIYVQTYKKQQILLNAKKTYWALSYARTVSEFRKLSLGRSKKILDWNMNRFNKDLAEKNDVLQSKALYKGRELTLKQAQDDIANASRNFNEMINISSNIVDSSVESIDNLENYFKNVTELERTDGKRADTLASMANAQSYAYAQEEKNKSIGSDLKLTGKLAFNGVDSSFSEAFSEMTKLQYPSWTLGLSYSVPLDFSLQKSVNEGFAADIQAAKKQAEQADLTEKNDWIQLNTNWKNALEKYEIAKEINQIQQERNIEEQKLLKRGRSTTFEMIQSEDDLDNAVLTQYQMSMDLIFILLESQMLYNTQTITLE
ncbi:MAG: TolC family protein [Endomicrobiaceae bacterium]|nr:TolC family protein [Endomicrobiaceae bacterium]